MLIRLIFLSVILLIACTPLPVQEPVSSLPLETRGPSSNPMPAPTDISPATIQQKMTDIAIQDLSSRLAIDPGVIRVISTTSIVWPDAALGCPRPGKVYAQGTVPGFRVELEAGGQIYDYHTDKAGNFILCLYDDLPSFPVTPGEIQDGQPWVPVN